jgi:hypothetical protein
MEKSLTLRCEQLLIWIAQARAAQPSGWAGSLTAPVLEAACIQPWSVKAFELQPRKTMVCKG